MHRKGEGQREREREREIVICHVFEVKPFHIQNNCYILIFNQLIYFLDSSVTFQINKNNEYAYARH